MGATKHSILLFTWTQLVYSFFKLLDNNLSSNFSAIIYGREDTTIITQVSIGDTVKQFRLLVNN